ncbi:hypothetical protein ACPXCE_08760 [Streptomyces sp. DT24]|uniref:hypothetical protein n=1 Tax=Streptomyces sp. DT24 TaxID=3416520 RepID=UPI003CF389FA
MQRGLVHALAWSLATGAAVTLSWWGVHTVMAGTAYDPPRALPISKSARGGGGSDALSSSTHRPEPVASPSPSATRSPTPRPPKPSGPPPKPAASTPSSPPARPRPSATKTKTSSSVSSYGTEGGRVVLEMEDGAAKLVSATPRSGWSMRVWTNTTWVRVDFAGNDTTITVFCTWNDHEPQVDIERH